MPVRVYKRDPGKKKRFGNMGDSKKKEVGGCNEMTSELAGTELICYGKESKQII